MLTWTAFLPSIIGFHLTNNSACGRQQVNLSSGVMTPRRSPLLPNHSMSRSIQLNGIWGPSSPSSSSSSSSNEDDCNDDEEVVEGTEEPPVDEAVVETSMLSTDASSENIVAKASSTDSTEKSLWVLLNEIGNNFQAMAQKSTTLGYQSEDQYKKILFAAKACVYYTLFIIYRTYRGFFVLLPATFREVYKKMEMTMNTGNLSMEEIDFTESGNDTTSNVKWGTKITVSILTSVITTSYVVGGMLKMASKFFRTIVRTSDVPKSFGAAADEVLNFEGRINRVGKVNGDESVGSSGLAP